MSRGLYRVEHLAHLLADQDDGALTLPRVERQEVKLHMTGLLPLEVDTGGGAEKRTHHCIWIHWKTMGRIVKVVAFYKCILRTL